MLTPKQTVLMLSTDFHQRSSTTAIENWLFIPNPEKFVIEYHITRGPSNKNGGPIVNSLADPVEISVLLLCDW